MHYERALEQWILVGIKSFQIIIIITRLKSLLDPKLTISDYTIHIRENGIMIHLGYTSS